MQNVDKYLATFPVEIQNELQKMRRIILENAPEAAESMAYGMPAYKIKRKPLVYFAGYKNHIGFYATPTGHAAFAEELGKFKQGKGSVQFPLHSPIPFELVRRIVVFRREEQLKK